MIKLTRNHLADHLYTLSHYTHLYTCTPTGYGTRARMRPTCHSQRMRRRSCL